jgi:tRNA-modifying protein YgfZ
VNPDDAVASTADFIDDSARDRVTVSGADAQTYLQSQLAQELRDLAVGAARWSLVLDPTGKVDSLARVRRSADVVFVLDTDAGFGEALMARVNRFKIRVAADVTLETAESPSPAAEFEQRRVEAGWPRMGAEIEPGSTIPATTGLVPVAVNLKKGCYPGQELVERMDSRGADAPRSLRVLEVGVAVADGVRPGDSVVGIDGTDVGVVTSVAPDGCWALGYVKRGADVGTAPFQLD